MKMQTLALFSVISVAIGGVAWVFLYPIISGERNAERRRASVAKSEPVARASSVRGQKTRREQVEETLKDLDVKAQKPKNPPLHIKIQQAGLSWSKQRFMITAAGL